MPIYKDPEKSAQLGGLDDAAFTDGSPVSAHVLRELARNTNRAISRAHLVFRWVSAASGFAGGGEPGSTTGHATPGFFPFLGDRGDAGGYVVPKRFGLEKLRMRIRAKIDSGRTLAIKFSTLATRQTDNPDRLLSMAGTGAMAVYDFADLPCRFEHGEQIAMRQHSSTNTDHDPFLSLVTYGGVNNGTIESHTTTEIKSSDLGVAFSTNPSPFLLDVRNATIAAGGLTVHAARGRLNNSATAIAAGNADSIAFFPPLSAADDYVGHKFYLRELVGYTIDSVVIYTQERAAL